MTLSLGDRIGALLLQLAAWAGLLFLALPLFVIVGASFTETEFLSFPPQGFTLRWYQRFLDDPSYLHAIGLSAGLALGSTLLATLLGVPAALVIARGGFPGRRFVNSLFLSPLILPTIVIGAALLQFASSLGFARTVVALLTGHTVIVIPYVVRTVLASLQRFDTTLEEASLDLGSGPLATFFRITLPLIRPGIVAGSLFGFIISWINVELSIFNSTATMTPIPVKMFNYVQYSVDPMLAAISAATIYVAIVAILILDMVVGIDRIADQN